MTPQDVLQFFLDILPPIVEDTCYITAGRRAGSKESLSNDFCPTLNDLLIHLHGYYLTNRDAYFAVGLFGNAGNRKADNVIAKKSFYIDLDVDKPKNSYPTVEEAMQALLAFAQETDLTPSYLVFSGKGLHAYWVLTEPVSAVAWKPIALQFKALVQQHLTIDPVVPADSTRILRMPGSIHSGTGLQVAILRRTAVQYTLEEFRSKLGGSTPLPLPDTTGYSNSDPVAERFGLTNLGPQQIYRAKPIVWGCAQVMSAGHAPEPTWFRALTLLKRCVDGREWAHKISALDATRYEYEQTDAKFDHAVCDMPPRCDTFAQLEPSLCQRCPYHGQIKSPISLSTVITDDDMAAYQGNYKSISMAVWAGETPAPFAVTESITPDVDDVDDAPIAATLTHTRVLINSNQSSFKVDSSGIYYKVVDADGSSYWDLLTKAQMYFLRMEKQRIEGKVQTILVFEVVSVVTHWQSEEQEFFMNDSAGERELGKWLANTGILPIMPKKKKLLMAFLNAYLSQITNEQQVDIAVVQRFTHCGWVSQADPDLDMNPDSFAIGNVLITSTGVVRASYTDKVAQLASSVCGEPTGSLMVWKNAPRIYRKLQQPLGQLAMCLSFAGPLFIFSGHPEVRNCVFSIFSQESGLGKTQLLRIAASVWGNPNKAVIQKDSSLVYRQRHVSIMHNIPVMMDEITDMEPAALKELLFALTAGVEKQKLTSTSEIKDTGSWNTCIFMTSNISFKEAIANVSRNSEAGFQRLLEVYCNFQPFKPHTPEYAMIANANNLIENNYGLAGPKFMQRLLADPNRLNSIGRLSTEWVTAHNFDSNQRFNAYALALAMIAGRWACEWGLLDYNMDNLESWILSNLLVESDEATNALVKSDNDWFAEFIDDCFIRDALIVRRANRSAKEPMPALASDPDLYVIKRPTRQLSMRYEQEDRVLYISKKAFRDWCGSQNIQAGRIWHSIKKNKKLFLSSREARIFLGKNVQGLSDGFRTCCYRLALTSTADILDVDDTVDTVDINNDDEQ